MKILENETKEKKYLILPISGGKGRIIDLINITNEVLSEFQLENYFENPIPHITLSKEEEIQVVPNKYMEFEIDHIIV